MILALRAIGSAIGQVLGHFGAMLVANIVATVFSIPLLLALGLVGYVTRSYSLVPLGIALLLGALPSPASAGVQYSTYELAQGEILTFSDQWDGLRRYWAVALRTWLVSLVVTIVLLANMLFYARGAADRTFPLHALAAPVAALWVALFLFWLCLHLYVFPLLIAQAVPRLLTTYRNAAVMALGRPLVTLTVVPVWLAIVSLCATTGLVAVFGLAIGAAIQQNATARLLPTFRRQSSQ